MVKTIEFYTNIQQALDFVDVGVVNRVVKHWREKYQSQFPSLVPRWRTSRIGLFNNGYIALTKISNVAFYGYRDFWHLSGYPGPPQYAVDALPQFQNA